MLTFVSVLQLAPASMHRARAGVVVFLLLGMLYTLAPPSSAQQPTWQPIGPPGGNAISLALSPQNSVYLGTADGHIFYSADEGAHWTLRGRVGARQDAVVQRLLVNRRDENDLLAAVWFQDLAAGGALFRSSDAGRTWSVAGLSGEIVRTVEQSLSDPQIFVAGARSGVFRSTDAGQSWLRISPVGDPELRNVDSLAIDARDPQIIYAGTYHLPWKSIDGGKSWNAIPAGMIDDSDVMSLRVDATTSSRIFASACSGIYRSENAGTLWTKLQGIPYSSRRTQAIVQDPQNPQVLYAATTEGLWLTRDVGESWTRTTPRDWVVNDVVVLPRGSAPAPSASLQTLSSRILLATEAQGLLLSNDAGLSFAPANEGFSHRITAGLVGDPRDPQHLLAWMPSSPDPLLESRDGGSHWQALPGTSSIKAAEIARIFPGDSGWWLANAHGALFSYDAADAKWNAFRYASPPNRKASASRAGTHGRPRVRPPATVSPAAPPVSAAEVYDLRTAGALVYLATAQGLWSANLGERILRPLTPGVPQASMPAARGTDRPALASSALESSAETSGRLWLAAGGKILFSPDAGKAWHEEPQTIAADLTATDVRWLREIPASAASDSASGALSANGALAATPQNPARILLAATTKGLYRRSAPSGAWQLVQNGLPAAEPVAYFFRGTLCLIALRSGGLYLSDDSAQTWERLDSGPLSGQFTGAAATANGTIVAASLAEGLLRVAAIR